MIPKIEILTHWDQTQIDAIANLTAGIRDQKWGAPDDAIIFDFKKYVDIVGITSNAYVDGAGYDGAVRRLVSSVLFNLPVGATTLNDVRKFYTGDFPQFGQFDNTSNNPPLVRVQDGVFYPLNIKQVRTVAFYNIIYELYAAASLNDKLHCNYILYFEKAT